MTAKYPASPVPPLELLVEVAPDGICFGHIPSLPGLCFRADNTRQLHEISRDKIIEYTHWLMYENLADLNPLATEIVHCIHSGRPQDIHIIETERRDGAPLWISGNPAVLFNADNRALNDTEVRTHLRIVRQAAQRIRVIVTPFTPAQLEKKPAADRRSINETLVHVGNCVWWYCSRLSDTLPEPEKFADEEPIDRIERLLDAAHKFLLAVPVKDRSRVYIPARFSTSDPSESWNHTKVCRRQAEHAWEHLTTLARQTGLSFNNPSR